MAFSSHSRSTKRTEFDPFVLLAWLIGIGAMLLFALPALVLGLLGTSVFRNRSWSVLLWLGLALPGIGASAFLIFHGLGTLVNLQLSILAWEVHLHQAQILQWDLARFWSATWPVWLHTLELAPVVASIRVLAASLHQGGSASLRAQEQARKQQAMRAQRWARRRLHRSSSVPDSAGGQMVIGIPIHDQFPQ